MLCKFTVVMERDAEGYYVASVPQMPACHTQARSLGEVMERIREAIELCPEVEGAPEQPLQFIGVQRVTIAACAGLRAAQDHGAELACPRSPLSGSPYSTRLCRGIITSISSSRHQSVYARAVRPGVDHV